MTAVHGTPRERPLSSCPRAPSIALRLVGLTIHRPRVDERPGTTEYRTQSFASRSVSASGVRINRVLYRNTTEETDEDLF
jgi:hypothetical protein